MAKDRSTPFAGCTMAASNVTRCEPLTQRASCCRATPHSALPLGDGRSVQLGAGQFHHLAPLLGLFHDELAEVARRAPQCDAAEVGKPRLHLGVGNACIDLLVELFDDL